ncbi:hypothetical protein [uncultured Paracoccus sp.]|uniref:hypothetical protein n=1 Tax=uncultured Paracoccus sp. TaxID=189685 RepID=UPI00262D7F9E|nr:hypothetical protein [uncultured Paracoccus sp.]
MKPLAALIIALGLSACSSTDSGGLLPMPPLSAPENQLLARNPGGAWADAAPLAGLQDAGAACATTDKGSACLLQGDATQPNRNLATAREGRCLARWSGGPGTSAATVTLHRNAFPSQRAPLFERLYYLLNSGGPLDVTSRLTDPAGFTRLCDQLLRRDPLTTWVYD